MIGRDVVQLGITHRLSCSVVKRKSAIATGQERLGKKALKPQCVSICLQDKILQQGWQIAFMSSPLPLENATLK